MFGLLMFCSLGFMISFHPLVMGVFLMLSTGLTAVSAYFIFGYSWFSYIMVLVFLGGMLILFIYIASLASNEFVKVKGFYWVTLVILFLIPAGDWVMMSSDNSVVKLYEVFPVSIVTLFLVSYLLLTFIAVIKLVNLEMGPMREFSYD